MFLCSICKKSFKYRCLIFEHMSSEHKRKIVDNDDTFYKCFCCQKTFTSCDRSNLLTHIEEHELEESFCTDCNSFFGNLNELELHRSKFHLDFSVLINKLDPLKVIDIQDTELLTANPKLNKKKGQNLSTADCNESELATNNSSQEPYEQQSLIIQTADGSILNNLIINENGELVSVQNYDELLTNGHDLGESSQLQQIEQFLLEQGITDTTGISYIQTEDGQILLQTDESQVDQETLMQILEQSQTDNTTSEQPNSEEEIEVANVPKIAINPENQAALDELGDILLEVAAAANSEKTPTGETSTKIQPEKRKFEQLQNGKDDSQQKRINRMVEEDQPVKNFSQAYEYFVKGFNEMRNKIP